MSAPRMMLVDDTARHPMESERWRQLLEERWRQSPEERWRQLLEERWRQKLDEVIALSRACYDGELALLDEAAADGARAAAVRLKMRLYQAHEDLAEIGATIEAVAVCPPIACDGCGRLRPHGWVREDNPGKCPECTLAAVRRSAP